MCRRAILPFNAGAGRGGSSFYESFAVPRRGVNVIRG